MFRRALLGCLLFAVGTDGSWASDESVLTVSIEEKVDGRCVAAVNGTSFDVGDQPAMDAALRPYRLLKGEVRIIGDINVPYRCIGILIYTLQRHGYNKIGFLSDPAEQ